MINLDELDGTQLRALKLGDEVAIRVVRGPEFRSYVADAALVLGQMPAHLVMSIQQNEPREIVTPGTVIGMNALGPQVEPGQVSAKSVYVELAQVRLSPDLAVSVVMALLTQLAPTHSRAILAALEATPVAKAIFKPNV